MSTALVTGGAGFIGRHLVRQLHARGTTVRVLDPAASPRLFPAGVDAREGSILDDRALAAAMQGVETVYHLAAIAHLWRRNRDDFERVNHQGTRLVLDAARRAGAARVIVTSSEVILRGWDEASDVPLREDAPSPPLAAMAGPYSRSKHRADKAARDAGAISLYPTVPVGPGDDAMTAPTAMLALFARRPPPAYLATTLNLVPVEDVAAAHILAAEKARAGERFLIGGEDWPMARLLDFLARHLGRPMPRRQIPYSLARLSAGVAQGMARFTKRAPVATVEGVRLAKHGWRVESDKARAALGWTAGPVAEALLRALAWLEGEGKPLQP
ncbi:MAG: NAD-dependent epimerase/dehydratase family protein [Pseudomonadota bacterium]